MRFPLVLAAVALLSTAASAAEAPPLELRPLFSIPATYLHYSPDLSVAVGAGETAVSVWRLSDGRQIGRFPTPKTRPVLGDKDFQSFTTADVSPDGKWALVVRNQRTATKGDRWRANEKTLLLMSLADGSAKELWRGKGYCTVTGSPGDPIRVTICPDGWGKFLGDGSRVAALDESYSEDSFDGATWEYQYRDFFMDRAGKVYARLEGARRPPAHDWERPVLTGEPAVTNIGDDGRGGLLGPLQDGSGCELVSLPEKKHVSFLDGCTDKDGLIISGGLVTTHPSYGSKDKGPVKVWDAATGDLLYSGLGLDVSAARAARADAAFLLVDGVLEARDGRFQRVLGSTTVPSDLANSFIVVSPGGGRLALAGYSATQFFSTGLRPRAVAASEPPPSQPAAPRVDIDAPPAVKTKRDPDAYAVVIGVEKYRQEGIPAVDFAARDARTMYSYLTQSMGYDPKNVVLLTDDHATRTDFLKYLGTWLSNRVDAKSRVFIYYAGHGSPNPATGEGYLMPYEADPAYLADTAFPIARLYSDLGKLPTKDVTVVLDSCFSGQGGRSLIAKGARPLVTVQAAKTPANAVVLTAAGGAQISAADPDRRHGLLTAYLLEALHGAADKKGDGKITAEEVFDYVRPAVERAARLQNVEQTPTLAGKPGPQPWLVLAK